MDLDSYVTRAQLIADELFHHAKAARAEYGEPTNDQAAAAIAEFHSIGEKSTAVRLAVATPAQARKILDMLPESERAAALELAAILAADAAEFLEDVDARLQPVGPYRKKLLQAIILNNKLHRR